MKTKEAEFNKIKAKILRVLKKYGIKKAGIFGSYARGEQKRNSDVDILIQPPKKMSLLDFVGVKLDLEDVVGQKIDLLSYNGIHPMLRRQILKEEVKVM